MLLSGNRFDGIYKDTSKWIVNGEKQYEQLKPFLPALNSKATAIEVGCVRGELSAFLQKHFTSLICCDISTVAMEATKKRLCDCHNIIYLCEDFILAKIPVVEYVISNNTFYYIPPEMLLTKLSQITRMGSTLIAIECDFDSLKHKLTGDIINKEFKQIHFQQFIIEKRRTNFWVWKKL